MHSLPSILAKFSEQEMKIIHFLSENEAEDLHILAEEFFKTQEELHGKINAWCWVLSYLDNEIDYYKQQEVRFANKRKVVENKKARMKAYLQQVISQQGGKVDCQDFKLSVRKTQPKLVISDEIDIQTIPSKYINLKPEIDRQLLKDDLKKGIEVDFAVLEQGTALYIK